MSRMATMEVHLEETVDGGAEVGAKAWRPRTEGDISFPAPPSSHHWFRRKCMAGRFPCVRAFKWLPLIPGTSLSGWASRHHPLSASHDSDMHRTASYRLTRHPLVSHIPLRVLRQLRVEQQAQYSSHPLSTWRLRSNIHPNKVRDLYYLNLLSSSTPASVLLISVILTQSQASLSVQCTTAGQWYRRQRWTGRARGNWADEWWRNFFPRD